MHQHTLAPVLAGVGDAGAGGDRHVAPLASVTFLAEARHTVLCCRACATVAVVVTLVVLAPVPTVANGTRADGLPILQLTLTLVAVVLTDVVLTVGAMVARLAATVRIP